MPTRRLMRLAGLGVIAWIQVSALLRLWLDGTQAMAREAAIVDWGFAISAAPPAMIAVALVALGFLLAGLFWVTTSRGPERQGWTVPGLALLTSSGIVVSSDVLVLVAVATPFVLPLPAAHRAAVAQMCALGATSLGAGLLGVLAPAEPVVGAPHWVQGLLAVLTLLLWQAVAYGMGYIAVSEGLERGELGRLNAEFEATQQMLAASARGAERSRVAGALQDRLSRRLSALVVALELAARRAEGGAGDTLRVAQAAARRLVSETGQVLSELKDASALDLRASIEALVVGVSRPLVHLRLAGDLASTDPEHAHALFRCAQEGVTNALRHADASNLWISAGEEGDELRLVVRDDGRGARDLVEGNGLRGMRERLAEARGRLEVRATPGEGLVLTVSVPLRA